MNRLSLTLLLAAPLALGAQEAVVLDQSVSVSYNEYQASLGGLSAGAATTQATYQFDLGMPVLAYRLGSVNVGGAVGYVRQSGDTGSDATVGLNSVGLSGSLFPYQPYHISFDFTRTTSPDLFDSGSQEARTFGLGLIYRGAWVQNLQVAYRHGSVHGPGGSGSFSSWSLSDAERRGNTDIRISADRQDARFGPTMAWGSTTLTVGTQTQLPGTWMLSNSISAVDFQGTRFVVGGATLSGTSGPWTSMSSMDLSYAAMERETIRSGGLSQSLARTWGRFAAFTQVGVSGGSSSDSRTLETSLMNVIVGGSYRLNANWSLMADVSGAWNTSQGPSTGYGQGPTRSMHVGATWGGALPEILKHAMFYWSNLRFQQRLEEDYPPGFLPPEMAKVQLRRRQEQNGALQFSTDIYRLENGGPGHQDWYRIQGGLSFPGGLMVQTVGDFRKDDRLSRPDRIFQDRHLVMHGAYAFTDTSVNFGMGYSKSTSEMRGASASTTTFSTAGDLRPTRATTYYSVGMSTFAWHTPVGVTMLRNNDALGYTTTSLMAYTSKSYGKTSFNISLQRGWRSDGLRTSQITINLSRWFDTIPLWIFGD